MDALPLFTLPQFSAFAHRFYQLPFSVIEETAQSDQKAEEVASGLEKAYWACLGSLGNQDHSQDKSYNFLLFDTLMLIVPRTLDTYKEDGLAVGVNSLGFAGTLAVMREEDKQLIEKYGPLGILQKLGEETVGK